MAPGCSPAHTDADTHTASHSHGDRHSHGHRDTVKVNRRVTVMRIEGPALRLTIFVGESDQWHRRPLYHEVVARAHAAGLAGASVLRGIEGYGASSRIHTTRILSLSGDLPLAIVIVDVEHKIRDFLPQLDELITEGLVIIDPVEVVRYVGRPAGREAR